jgi:hypothetical protein
MSPLILLPLPLFRLGLPPTRLLTLGVHLCAADVKTLAQAQAALRRMAALLRGCGAGHAGLHDVLLLYASVRHWVGQEDYVAFSAKLANVRTDCLLAYLST